MSTPTYYTLLTAIGAAELVNSQAFGNTVPITHLAVGDGNGNPVVPIESMVGLVHEVHRVPVSSMTVDVDNPNWLIIEAVLPSTVGGWTIREIGLLGGSGAGNKLLAVGNFPDTYKPLVAEGAAKDLVIRMIIEVSSAAIVNLTVNSGVAVATTASVANAIAAHEGKADPHTQYLTQPRGDARYRLKTDVIASSDVWFSTDITPTLPATGGMRMFNVDGTNTVTLDISPCTINKVALAISNMGGAVNVAASNGVVLNPPITSSAVDQSYFKLTNKSIPQGLWSGSMTYGRRTYLAYQSSYSAVLAKGAIIMGDITCLVLATGSGLWLAAYDTVNKTLGTGVLVASWNDESYQNAQKFSIFALDASRFVVIGSVNAVVATLTGMKITVGAVETHGASGNPLYLSVCQLSASAYLIAGYDGSGNTIARVLTVAGTTVTANALATGPAPSGGNWGKLIALSSTLALFCITQRGFIAMSISGTTVTIGASYTTFPGQNEARLLDAISATTALVYGYNTGNPSTYQLAVATVAGTTVTLGTPTTVTESGSSAPSQLSRPIPYPYNDGADVTRCIKIDASTWALAIAKLRAVSVTGTTVSVGSAINSGASSTYISKLPDGNLVVSDNVINGVKPFTVAGTTITLGNLLFTGLTTNLVGHSINDFAGYKNIGGTYFSYPMIGGTSTTDISSIFSIPGNATVFQGDTTSYFLRDKYI